MKHNWICCDNLSLDYYPCFLSSTVADDYLTLLQSNLDWKQEEYVIYGRPVKSPRLTAWYGDTNAFYKYSGVNHESMDWTDDLLSIKALVEQKVSFSFNSVLANWYRDGQDSMGWHADNEPELGSNPIIASLSLGETRKFCLRHNKQKEIFNINPAHGSLLVMRGETQHYWKHSVPKTKKQILSRINLTFRRVET